MEAFCNSFLLVFLGEMGDKTQLLSLVLASRYKRPWTILLGVFIATLLNHALAAWGGGWLSSLVNPDTLRWILAITFFAFAIWILIPDKEGKLSVASGMGALATTIIAFFIAEMGDKTQLATVALGARYPQTWVVTMSTTLAMVTSNALAVFLGRKLLQKIPMKWVRIFASILFLLFGITILYFEKL